MPQQPQQQNQPPSIREGIEFANWLSIFGAISVLVFWRKDLGARILSGKTLVFLPTFIMCVALFFKPIPRSEDLVAFAVAFPIAGIRQRLKRASEYQKNVPIHSYYIGTSPLDSLPVFAFCRRHRRMARFADPLAIGIMGIIIFQFSPLLGAWITLAAASVFRLELAVFFLERNRQMNIVDALVSSQIQGEHVEKFNPLPQATEHSSHKPQSIPTGLSADIQKNMHRKK